ncbi:terminase TerL endonuclease subunit [Stenotrophomonas sp. SMYL20]|uniref:terminase large subunit n=1 Tax=Stenotrophomonas sp. SMYL20 TaxID=3076043 RepID=UPI002E77AD82|nr:terminase TerL endonuclease subunit [Stenotrophomonas sp. SMYL20]
MRDYVSIATAYAEEAVADKKGRKFGKWVRLAAKRFLADLKRAKRKRPPFLFDEWHACDPCDFIEKLPHVEGKWARPEIELHRSHVFFVVQLFGFRNLDGSRRFTSALFAVARKNAKSTLAAAILLYCQCCEEEEGAQIISAATTGSQARIIFNVAKRMTEKTPDLQEAFGLACWANSISRMETGASFKPINAKASTQDGLNPSHVGLDEIHAHKSADLLNVLTSAAGARSNPLWLYTTTEGYTNPGPWGEIRQFAKQVLQGILGDSADHFLVVFYAVDEDDDEFDESAWPKANPLMDANPHLLKAIRKEAVEARQMPSKLAEFKIKRLNRPASSATGWVDLTKWQKGGGAVDLDWLAGHPCWAGLDLASNLDLTSWRLVWKVDEIYYTWGRRFVPEDAVRARTERGVVPYAGWVAAGLIEVTEGEVTDYQVVEARMREDIARFNPLVIGFDKWNAQEITQRLLAEGHPLIEFGQTTKNYHPAMQELERAYVSKKIVHGNDPVLNWCASNLIAVKDGNLNQKPDKKRSPDKIDDMVSLLMAIGLSITPEESQGDLDGFFSNPIVV